MISLYLKAEGKQLNTTQKTMIGIFKNYILLGTNSKVYEISERYSSTLGLNDYSQKLFYTEEGYFLGGWKRTTFKTIQLKPTINYE